MAESVTWDTSQEQAPEPITWDKPAEQPKPPPPDPMPGFFESIGAGAKRATQEGGQSLESFEKGKPTELPPETSPAAAPLEWSDVLSPQAKLLPKLAYQTGKSYPSVGLGIAGGSLGTAAGTAVAGPVGGAIGGIGGGAVGAAAGAAFQSIGPYFQDELKKTPNDPEGAWNHALQRAEVSGAFSGAGWALFPLKFFQGPVKNLAFQAFGVQPGVSVAHKATENVMEGKPATEDLGQAYTQGAMGTLPLAIGQKAVEGITAKRPAPEPTGPPQSVKDKLDQADQLSQQGEHYQADVLRLQAANEDFLSKTQPLAKGSALGDFWKRNFQPELVSDEALKADPLFARYKSATAQEKDAIIHRGEENYYKWNQAPVEDRLEFMRAFEAGEKFNDPWMQERADAYKKTMAEAYKLEKEYGSRAGYIKDYFPHLWKEPAQAAQVFENLALPQSHGPKWFQKARYHETIEAGLAHGLELKTTNPEELVTMRLLAGADMRQKVELLQRLREQGLAIPTEEAPPQIANPNWRDAQNAWQQINAPNGKQWMIAPDVQPLWENAVHAKGLWSNEGLPGNAFRGWMALKNAWVPIKLALSAFHPLHVAHINVSNNLSRALNETLGRGQQGLLRRAVSLPEAATQAVFDNFLAMPIGLPFKGKAAREAWVTPRNEQTPEQRAMTDLFNEGGFSPQLSEQLRISAKRALNDALHGNNLLAGVWHGLRRPIEMIQAPIFEKWIPNLKAAAYLREAESLFRRRPDILNDPIQRGVALRAIGKQVDNRFGEMFYGGLFWNRTTKDAAIGSFLSLGWNLGFAREFVGGALEPVARRFAAAPTPTRQTIRDVTNKSTNAFVYTMTAMMTNGMMNYMMTGEQPEGYDYIFPRIGGNNPDGSPRRITNMFYTREVPMAQKNIEERQSVVGGLAQMLYHKLMFAPFVEGATNRDYFGYQMYDENAPGLKQMMQFGKHVLGEQLNPMSISGAKRALQLSGKPSGPMDILKSLGEGDRDVVMPLLGFPPAPAYASKTAIQNRIGHAYQQFVAPGAKPFEEKEKYEQKKEWREKYLLASQKKDTEKMAEAAKELSKLGVPVSRTAKLKPGEQDIYLFSQLPVHAQAAILRDASKDEFKRYYPRTKKDTKKDEDVRALWRKYYQG